METDTAGASTAKGCFGLIGLASVIGAGFAVLFALTLMVPPWLKVKCQRREVLYFSEVVQDYEKTFAGYHGLLASRDWQTEKSEPGGARASGQIFDVIEYRIYWGLLAGEWILILVTAGGLFLVLAYRLRMRSNVTTGKAEPSHAPDPAAGPVSRGKSSPPAR